MERYMMELQVHENVPVTPNLNRTTRVCSKFVPW